MSTITVTNKPDHGLLEEYFLTGNNGSDWQCRFFLTSVPVTATSRDSATGTLLSTPISARIPVAATPLATVVKNNRSPFHATSAEMLAAANPKSTEAQLDHFRNSSEGFEKIRDTFRSSIIAANAVLHGGKEEYLIRAMARPNVLVQQHVYRRSSAYSFAEFVGVGGANHHLKIARDMPSEIVMLHQECKPF
ncbi:hypothetical protein CBER1_11720 [Cercospora berteroae]|uniref:Uncharacterized protein n=1 Tax=Cercospora berteroae TaxID=357750 RepID=A0A2S6CN36_9PEZI|nr:hypothetical protein CBER1_11720 [Cercospora berteroae]